MILEAHGRDVDVWDEGKLVGEGEGSQVWEPSESQEGGGERGEALVVREEGIEKEGIDKADREKGGGGGDRDRERDRGMEGIEKEGIKRKGIREEERGSGRGKRMGGDGGDSEHVTPRALGREFPRAQGHIHTHTHTY
jgi:hypothetical protein